MLVLDADMTPSLAVARSLHRHGVKVTLTCADNLTERPVAAWSRACRRLLRHPDPLREAGAFVDWVARRLKKDGFDLVIPVTERSLIPLSRRRDTISDADRLALPPAKALEQVIDKDRTLVLADRLGVPFPARHRIADTNELAALADSTTFPVVLKPESSIAGNAMLGLRQLSVDYAFDADELRRKGADLLARTPFLAQEYVRGTGVGIELIAEHGEIRLAFQHRRIHELPLSGGGSSYRESVPVDPALLDAASRLIHALNWHGVAMVEFKQDPATGRFWLMEINGRLWGSLPLSVAAGADFPWLLYRLHTEGSLPRELPTARTGIRCRKLASDLLWYEQVLRGQGDPRLFQRPGNGELTRQALHMFTPSHRFDVQSISDPLPGLVDLWRIARDQVQRVTGLLHERSQKRRLAGEGERRRIRRLARGARRILFVCYGNINRSALAEALLIRLAGERNLDLIPASAGFHPVAGRPADPTMVEVARAQGTDLSGSASCILDAAMLEEADLILVMELRHRERLAELAPQVLERVALLGSLAPENGDPEIPDPYGQTPDTYRHCYRRIHDAVQALVDMLDG